MLSRSEGVLLNALLGTLATILVAVVVGHMLLRQPEAEGFQGNNETSAAAEAAAEAAAGDPTRSPDSGDADEALDHAKEALKPHSLQPAVLVSVELVPLAASVAFAKENGGKRPGLGREEPNAEPYLKDPGAILRQIEAVRRKRAGGHCCATM